MLFFELQKEVIKGQVCQTNVCPCCHSHSTHHSSVIQYLSLSFLPLAPIKVTTNLVCNRCSKSFSIDAPKRSHFPKVSIGKLFKKAIGLPIILMFLFIFNQYQQYEEQWQWQARHAPRVNDILYLDNYARTSAKEDEYFPIRMAKVISIDDRTNTLTLAISATAYDSLNTAKKDYAVRSYLFDTFYMRHNIDLSAFHLTDQSLVLNIRRPFGEESLVSGESSEAMEKYKDISRFFKHGLFDTETPQDFLLPNSSPAHWRF